MQQFKKCPHREQRNGGTNSRYKGSKAGALWWCRCEIKKQTINATKFGRLAVGAEMIVNYGTIAEFHRSVNSGNITVTHTAHREERQASGAYSAIQT